MELIKVTEENGKQVVSARELHEGLEIKKKFTDWMKQMIEYGFDENIDYVQLVVENVSSQKRERTYSQVDYALTLDMAKEISMIQRNEIGKKFRLYFLECEKKLKEVSIHPKLPSNYKEALIALVEEVEKNDQLVLELKETKPYAEKAKAIESSINGILVGNFARLLKNANINFGRNDLFSWLRRNGYLMKQSGESNHPKERWLKQGIFTLTQETKDTSNGSKVVSTTMITGKGQLYLLDKIVEDLDLEYLAISKELQEFVMDVYIKHKAIDKLTSKLMLLSPCKYEKEWEAIRELVYEFGSSKMLVEVDDILDSIAESQE